MKLKQQGELNAFYSDNVAKYAMLWFYNIMAAFALNGTLIDFYSCVISMATMN